MKKQCVPLLLVSLVLTLDALGQPPSDWEERATINIPSTTYVTAAVSDGYGQHILIRKNATLNHFLIGNDGATIYSNTISPEPVLNSEFSATIASGNGIVSVVASDGHLLKLWRSSNGGATWSSPATRPISTAVYNVDAIATTNDVDVHIVWDDGNVVQNPKVYYYRYHPLEGWQDFKEVTDIGGRGVIPKIALTSNRIIVSFTELTTDDDENKKGKSRDKLLGGAWETSYRTTSIISSDNVVAHSNITTLNNSVHMVVQPGLGAFGSDRKLRFTKRSEVSGWDSPISLSESYYGNVGDEANNFRRKIASGNGGIKTIFSHSIALGIYGLKALTYTETNGWDATSFTVFAWVPQAAPPAERITISSSLTGYYVFWSENIGSSPTTTSLRRNVALLTGAI